MIKVIIRLLVKVKQLLLLVLLVIMHAAAEDVVGEVNVSKIETDITVEEESLELNVGDEGSIEAELEPVEAGRVTHVSSG